MDHRNIDHRDALSISHGEKEIEAVPKFRSELWSVVVRGHLVTWDRSRPG
jgi:hypothetical protein